MIGPAAFMDNYADGSTLGSLREGSSAWPLPAATPLTLIPATDIGAFAALTPQRRAEFTGRRIGIASDERTPDEMAAILASAAGRPVTHHEVPLDHVRRHSTDLAAMFACFAGHGLDVDTAALRRAYPEVGWHSFADWAAAQDWAVLLAQTENESLTPAV